MSLILRGRALLLALACVVCFGAAAQPASAKTGPYQVSFLGAFGYSLVIDPDVDLFPAGPGATVKDVVLQDGCPFDFSDHLSMTYGHRSLWFIKKALDPSLRGSAPCLINPPVV